jgi:site-specific recombinase XerD
LQNSKGKLNDLVFPYRKGGQLNRGRVKRPYWAIAKLAGLRRIKIHEMRHTFASSLVIKGVHLQVVQELLGHSDIRQTMRYAHLAPNQHQEAIQVLEPKSGKKLGTEVGTLPILESTFDSKYMN